MPHHKEGQAGPQGVMRTDGQISSHAALASGILGHEPALISTLRPMSPPELDRIVGLRFFSSPASID